MAHLLGSRACIDSLRMDAEDLDSVTKQLVVKIGSIKSERTPWLFSPAFCRSLDAIRGNFRTD